MTTPPHQPGPHGRYGGQGAFGSGADQAWQLGGAPSHWYAEEPPPEPPRRRKGLLVAIVAAAVLVLGGAGVGIYLATTDDDTGGAAGPAPTSSRTPAPSTGEATGSDEPTASDTPTGSEGGGDKLGAQPGDCIKVNVASTTDADVETVDCAGEDAIYRVATRTETDAGTCPTNQYVTYVEAGELVLCLQLNVREGDCLEVAEEEDRRADCASPDATHRVLAVLDGVDDDTQCPDETNEAVTYPAPPMTVCLVAPPS